MSIKLNRIYREFRHICVALATCSFPFSIKLIFVVEILFWWNVEFRANESISKFARYTHSSIEKRFKLSPSHQKLRERKKMKISFDKLRRFTRKLNSDFIYWLLCRSELCIPFYDRRPLIMPAKREERKTDKQTDVAGCSRRRYKFNVDTLNTPNNESFESFNSSRYSIPNRVPKIITHLCVFIYFMAALPNHRYT